MIKVLLILFTLLGCGPDDYEPQCLTKEQINELPERARIEYNEIEGEEHNELCNKT